MSLEKHWGRPSNLPDAWLKSLFSDRYIKPNCNITGGLIGPDAQVTTYKTGVIELNQPVFSVGRVTNTSSVVNEAPVRQYAGIIMTEQAIERVTASGRDSAGTCLPPNGHPIGFNHFQEDQVNLTLVWVNMKLQEVEDHERDLRDDPGFRSSIFLAGFNREWFKDSLEIAYLKEISGDRATRTGRNFDLDDPFAHLRRMTVRAALLDHLGFRLDESLQVMGLPQEPISTIETEFGKRRRVEYFVLASPVKPQVFYRFAQVFYPKDSDKGDKVERLFEDIYVVDPERLIPSIKNQPFY